MTVILFEGTLFTFASHDNAVFISSYGGPGIRTPKFNIMFAAGSWFSYPQLGVGHSRDAISDPFLETPYFSQNQHWLKKSPDNLGW